MKIVLLKTWLTNIGNGFIDKGASAVIKSAYPDAEIVEVSGFPHFVSDHKARLRSIMDTVRGRLRGTESPQRLNHPARENIIDISRFVDADLAVLPGCLLYEWAIRKYKKTIERLKQEDVPLIFLGAGGGEYTANTRQYVIEFFKEIEPEGLITRDSKAYDYYSEYVGSSYNGIDCAFFIDNWYTPPEADRDFIVKTFDKKSEPELDSDSEIVRPQHSNPLQGWRGPDQTIPFYSEEIKQGTFYSDCLEDYLFLYANAGEVHADRIHAVVPSLIYKTPAKFHYETPRANLFKNIELAKDENGFLYLEDDVIANERQAQVKALRELTRHAIK